MSYEHSRSFSTWLNVGVDVGSASSTPNIDTAFVAGTSGDAFFVRLFMPEALSAGTVTLYAYVPTVTGTPDFQLAIYATSGADLDRIDAASNLASSPSTLSLSTADNGTWVALTCTATLSANVNYFLVVENKSGVPGSNYAVFQYRSALDGWGPILASQVAAFVTGYTLDGFSTDPTVNSTLGLAVVKLGSGIPIGLSYVASEAHASNANDRGTRVKFTEDVVVSGVGPVPAANSGAQDGLEINTAAGANVVSVTTNAVNESRQIVRFAPTTLSGGTSYDIVSTFASASTIGAIYNMGEIEANVPADVLACKPAWIEGYVDGATPGSYTLDTSKICALGLLVDDFPAIAGGGGGLLTHPGMSGRV